VVQILNEDIKIQQEKLVKHHVPCETYVVRNSWKIELYMHNPKMTAD